MRDYLQDFLMIITYFTGLSNFQTRPEGRDCCHATSIVRHLCIQVGMHVTGLLSPALPPSLLSSLSTSWPATAASVPAPKPSFAHNPQGGRDRASPLSHAQWEDGAACVCLRPALSTWVWHLMPLHRPIAVRLCRVTRIDKLIHDF